MFTGIVKDLGKIERVKAEQGNLHIWVASQMIEEISLDQSIAHNGICLTVDEIDDKLYRVTAINETIQKTNISHWETNDKVNLELCLRLGDRLDGHIVQGHIDTTGVCESITENNGSYEIQFSYPSEYKNLVIEKGSITLDGISLTCHSLIENKLNVSIIPYTWEHTNAGNWHKGTKVNIEFDILGKYLQRNIANS
jgi:riboflavin synthase